MKKLTQAEYCAGIDMGATSFRCFDNTDKDGAVFTNIIDDRGAILAKLLENIDVSFAVELVHHSSSM